MLFTLIYMVKFTVLIYEYTYSFFMLFYNNFVYFRIAIVNKVIGVEKLNILKNNNSNNG